MPKYELIPIEQLIEPEIPAREGMDEKKLEELFDSVREVGFIHPLAVALVTEPRDSAKGGKRPAKHPRGKSASPRYEIADGHRRYKVATMLELEVVPCSVFPDLEIARQAIKLHANLFREDLSTAEEAAFIADLITKYDYTEEALCRAVHQKVSWVNERLLLLRGNKDVFDALRERKINFAVAKQLNRVKDEAQTRVYLDIAIQGGCTAVMMAKWVSEFLARKVSPEAPGEAVAAAVEVGSLAVAGPRCFFCRKDDHPYNMENVWIHEWERKMIEANVDRAAQLSPEDPPQSVPANGRS